MGQTFSDEGQFEAICTKRILVTGGTGLVGKGIQAAIKKDPLAADESYIFLSSRDGDLRDKEATRAIFRRHRPTHVIHLAALVGGLFANQRRKVDFFRENILINDNIMECCREFGVEKLVSCLSTCIFPDKTTYPIDETMIHDGAPHESNEGYAYAKRLIDVMNRCYQDQHGCKFTSIVPTNVYGPYDNFSIEEGHVIPGLVHKAYLAKERDSNFIIWGSGTPLRQFIHAEDLGALTVWTMRNYDEVDPIILSVGEEDEVSIADVAKMIAKEMGLRDDQVQFDTSKADGQFKKTASNAKLRTYLPDYEFKPMDEGIREVVAWFRRNYANARK
uniref:GDP-L-fucose synthase n=2 Tax=Phaeomonas parva TaxID=124430 RepID=A0A6U4CW21_9STRA|mmetsp:Transcript_10348/g.31002  ORF Transcript_10348/g.31002 Transcript_10348/m.31002 type:complete len:332 (+) Transcript_10348:169-1164(+)